MHHSVRTFRRRETLRTTCKYFYIIYTYVQTIHSYHLWRRPLSSAERALLHPYSLKHQKRKSTIVIDAFILFILFFSLLIANFKKEIRRCYFILFIYFLYIHSYAWWTYCQMVLYLYLYLFISLDVILISK